MQFYRRSAIVFSAPEDLEMRIIRLVICCLLLMPVVARGAPGPAPAGPGTLAATNIDLIGHFGGPAGPVVVRGDYAYVGIGVELAVLNIAVPFNPIRVGYTLLPNTVTDIAIAGNYAYLANGETGLRVVDISNPAMPREVGFYDPPGYARQIILVGQYAYLAAQTLLVIDIANPVAPRLVASIPPPGGMYFLDIAIQGNYAYTIAEYCYLRACGPDSLVVYNISNPAAPSPANQLSIGGSAADIAVAGRFVYIASGQSGSSLPEPPGTLLIVDVSDIAALKIVATYPIVSTATQVTIIGQRAYVADKALGLTVLNIAKPSAPRPIITYDLPGYFARGIAITNGYAYVAVSDRGLRVIDLAAPAASAQVGAYDAIGVVQDITIVGNNAYIVDRRGMHTLDIARPATPVRLGTYDQFTQGPTSLTVAGRYAYLGRYAYMDGGQVIGEGLYSLDISNPAAPALVSHTTSPRGVADLALVGAYLYVADMDGLWILDVARPAAPAVIGFFETSREVLGLAVAGRYAYLIGPFGAFNSLMIIDVADPAHPVEIGSLQLPYATTGAVNDIVVAGRYAYVSGFAQVDPQLPELSGYLATIDIANPTAPSQIALHPTFGGRITLSDNYVYTAGGWLSPDGYVYTPGGLVVDVTAPDAPVMAGSYPLGMQRVVAIAGGKVYMGGETGLYVLDFNPLELHGRVADALGRPIVGVEIDTGAGQIRVTNDAGLYRFAGLPQGSYTLTPTLAGYAFEPPSATIALNGSIGQDFTILPAPLATTLTPGVAASLTYTDTQGMPTSLIVGAGAVSQTTMLTVTPALAPLRDGLAFTGHAFTLAAAQADRPVPDLLFAEPVSVTIGYADTDVQVITDERELTLWWWDGSGWVDAAETCAAPSSYTREPDHNTLRVSICRTGRFSLYGPTHRAYLPVVSSQ